MFSGRPPPEWQDLRHELAYAVEGAGATHGFVWDAWGLVWGSDSDLEREGVLRLSEQIDAVMQQLEHPLEQGGRLAGKQDVEGPECWCYSFAATYVLMFWFDGPPDELKLRRIVNGALPRVEARTLAIPSIEPDGGPGGGLPSERRVRLYVPQRE